MEVDYRGFKHIFVIGAGASVEYGLPTWLELAELIKKKVSENTSLYEYSKEIVEWIDKVGESKSYSSIDECIAKESIAQEYHITGPQIENEIFQAMRDVFTESYVGNNQGWIRKLNEKILQNDNLRESFAFINYNYDDVLDKNFLNINYLSEKERRLTYRDRLSLVSSMVSPVFHPHGFLFVDNPQDQILHISKSKHTIKTPDKDFHDAVSCHDSYFHNVRNGSYAGISDANLYILGLGGGMEINLNKINFRVKFQEIHVTIRDDKMKEKVLKYLSKKFGIPEVDINVYSSCVDLIENCF